MPNFADVTRRPLPTAPEPTARGWALRQETGHRHSNRLLIAMSVEATARFGGPPWSWDGNPGLLASRCGLTVRQARPYLRRLNALAITRFELGRHGELITDIGRYAYQGDYVRWYKPPYPPVPADLRAFVFERDGHRCRRCGTTRSLSLDHIFPQVYGGGHTPQNLQVLCRSCNSSKGDSVA